MANNAKIYDLTVRLKGDSAGYQSTFKKATTTNQHFSNSVSGVTKGLTAVEGPLNGVTGRVSALAPIITGVTGAAVGFGAAMSAGALLTVNAVKRLADYEVQQLKIQQMLKATGFAAGLSSEQLAGQAQAVALATLASVGEIQEAQGVLLSFKAVQGDTFNEAIRLSQDMAAVFGGTAKDKALQLGKALESPTEGLSALKRSGVSFTESQKEMIRSLDRGGDRVGAQALILKQLQDQIGGAGSAQAGGVAGSIDTLGQNWDEAMKSFAKSSGASDAAKSFLDSLASGLVNVKNALDGPTEQVELSRLVNERYELQQLVKKLAAGEHATGLSWIIGTESEWYNAQRQLNEVTAKIQGIQDKRKSDIVKAAADDKTSKTTQAAIETDTTPTIYDQLGYTEEQISAGIARVETSLQTVSERELAAVKSRQEMLDMAKQSGQITDEYWKELKEKNAEQHQAKLTEIAAKASKERADKEAAAQKAGFDALRSSSGMFLGALEDAGAKRTGLYKAMFAAQKAAAIPGMIASTEEGATAALALGPIAGPIAAGAIKTMGYASIGIVAGQSIAGVAHGGMGYVPEESTYLLQRGESVLSPKQNVSVQQAADRINNGQSGSGGVVVNIHEDASRAGQVDRETGLTQEDVINIYVANVKQEGAAALINQQTYGLERVGR